MNHRQRHLGAGFALDHVNDVAVAKRVGRLVVDLDDDVAGQDPRLVRGRADHGADDHRQTAAWIDAKLNAHAAEVAFGLRIELLELVGVHVFRIRIEPIEPAVDHVFDELLFLFVVEGSHEVLIDFGEHVHDGADQLVLLVALAGRRGEREAHAQDHGQRDGDYPGEVVSRHGKRWFGLSRVEGHGSLRSVVRCEAANSVRILPSIAVAAKVEHRGAFIHTARWDFL